MRGRCNLSVGQRHQTLVETIIFITLPLVQVYTDHGLILGNNIFILFYKYQINLHQVGKRAFPLRRSNTEPSSVGFFDKLPSVIE